MSFLIKIKDEEGEEADKGIPLTCGDCSHCAAVDIHLPKLEAMAKSVNSQMTGWYRAYRCQHPKGLDYRGRRTGVDPNGAPSEQFCPMYRGFQKNMSIICLGDKYANK